MATLTLEIPDELMAQLMPIQAHLPDLLRRCLQPVSASAPAYRYVVDFLASQPTEAQIANFRPSPTMQARLQYLLAQSHAGLITPEEQQELNDYEQIEHLIVMLKAGQLPQSLTQNP